ncbi:uncharacterized membrane protein YgaE (UPF0421/DUF939 family) [Clostridium algifaecis]|uniref:Uncharacterized membrane protein YgaE (UPF0421/DUF939 family) n=1 Tax=Clostridium algifaecis TaxID=1472040 RepID=A0ABS4KQP3_9CLOT|nr:hypothetical protein [Clostridium algifaecis]MBP2032352.1 uncharacterized membrane protein YgaE (UPF0421/DUF939 family) [Clostridium algifaecis]
MSHKKENEYKGQDEDRDFTYYENRANSLKKTVKQLEKIKRMKKHVNELERKKKKILKKMKKHHS